MSNHPLLLSDAAKVLHIGPKILRKVLRDRGVLGRLNDLPRRDLIDKGIFAIEQRSFRKGRTDANPGIETTYYVTLVTAYGMTWLQEVVDGHRGQEAVDAAH
ncbi:MAG TPA: phage antirepressor KilAC domain-containing protein [Hyphomicrobiales bacterium]|nr:phage antirepressor KilAC domain-containing protein [Hyphomicrobiales bacterium]